MNNISDIQDLLKKHASQSERKPVFFKVGPGDYAEHDQFLGVPVPILRKISKQFAHISLEEIHALLTSSYNEERLLALFMLISQYQRATDARRREIYQFYMHNYAHINNWNLVDSSAHYIVGAYLFHYDRTIDVLIGLAKSHTMWERRIAIVATLYFIRQLDFSWTLTIAELLLADGHDLIHKAVGWMLREVGEKDESQLKKFLDQHASKMPRTMLRSAIEKFSPDVRALYMKSVSKG